MLDWERASFLQGRVACVFLQSLSIPYPAARFLSCLLPPCRRSQPAAAGYNGAAGCVRWRLGRRPIIGDPSSIPGCGIDSQSDFGYLFHLGICFLRGTVGTKPCTHFTAALCVVLRKVKQKSKQNESKKNTPTKSAGVKHNVLFSLRQKFCFQVI